eukprot:TRINITY_DN38840_c0_g1_i1.p1 TRINITY_DN38840_c0_g1~~TRINITY_DN38840_c0_g1_i1.p1  ORF type:complete len:107 (+),score=1.30 TRINITY_DN38840_c0_g1_i1:86-406(+)
MEGTSCVTTVTFTHDDDTSVCALPMPPSAQEFAEMPTAQPPKSCQVKVIELLGEELGFHLWPSSLALAMYLMHNPHIVHGGNVLEVCIPSLLFSRHFEIATRALAL